MRRLLVILGVFVPMVLAGTDASAGLLGTQVQGCNGLQCSIGPIPQGFVTNTATIADPGIEFVGSSYQPAVQVDFSSQLMTLTRFDPLYLGNNNYAFLFPDVTITDVEFVSGTLPLSEPPPPCNHSCVVIPQSGMFLRFDAHTIILTFDNEPWEPLTVPEGPITETFRITIAEVPEPAAVLMFGAGLVFLGWRPIDARCGAYRPAIRGSGLTAPGLGGSAHPRHFRPNPSSKRPRSAAHRLDNLAQRVQHRRRDLGI